jgi:hypothetical protein
MHHQRKATPVMSRGEPWLGGLNARYGPTPEAIILTAYIILAAIIIGLI